MRSALSWDIMQCVVAIPYKYFGTTYQSHIQGSDLNQASVKSVSPVEPKCSQEFA